MKYFIVADVHGFEPEMMLALSNAGYDRDNKEHIFVSLGDAFDRGEYPRNVIRFMNGLPKDRKILIRGNHEDLMERAIARKDFISIDYHNGTANTLMDMVGNVRDSYELFTGMKNDEDYNTYINSTVDYYDDGKNVFVHGWIPCNKDDDARAKNQHYSMLSTPWQDGDWERARWINGMEAWSQGIRLEGKTIYCGHWHTSWGHHYLHHIGEEFPNLRSTNPEHRKMHSEPFVDDGIVALDACTAMSRKINCYVVEV